jgi:outer membrane protein
MKKTAVILFSILSFANAGLFNLSGGFGIEEQKIGGYVQGSKGKNYFGVKNVDFQSDPYTGYFGLQDQKKPYFWVKLTHSIPFIPNVKFQYNKYETSGHSNYIASNVTIFGKVSVNTILTDANTYMLIDSKDATFFYDFNTKFGNIEVGVGANYWKGTFRIYDNKTKKYKIDYTGTLLLPYGYGSIETPKYNNFSFKTDLKLAKLGEKHYYDVLGAIKYSKKFGIIEPFVKAGYKYKETYYNDENDNTTKLVYKGLFLEIGAKF